MLKLKSPQIASGLMTKSNFLGCSMRDPRLGALQDLGTINHYFIW
jgi:hypothetical protein